MTVDLRERKLLAKPGGAPTFKPAHGTRQGILRVAWKYPSIRCFLGPLEAVVDDPTDEPDEYDPVYPMRVRPPRPAWVRSGRISSDITINPKQ